MARFQEPIYYKRAQDPLQKKYNLQEAMKERLGRVTDWEMADAVEPSDYQNMVAPTINPPRPRARKIAYSKSAEKLVIRFRDGTWWEYNEIPVDIWNDLKASDSTGRYLKYSGLDTHDNMGPFNPNDMPEEVRVLFNG
jgi:hypothetical protein